MTSLKTLPRPQTAEKCAERKVRNRLSARKSRERRMAYVLQLENSLKVANERIRHLEAQLRLAREVESFVSEDCVLSQALFEPDDVGLMVGCGN